MSNQNTKQHILEIGGQLILRKGFNNTGLNEILEQSGVPKGSFYHYFSSKEDFGLQVIDCYEHEGRSVLLQYLHDTTRPPLERLKSYFEYQIEDLGRLYFKGGCLLGNVGQEMAGQNDQFRCRIEQGLSAQTANLAECLQAAQTVGELAPDADVQALAEFCLNAWQGAVLRAKVVKSPEPLHQFIHIIFNTLLRG